METLSSYLEMVGGLDDGEEGIGRKDGGGGGGGCVWGGGGSC